MSLGTFLHKVGAWFKKVFADVQTSIAPIAVTITEGLKTALDSGVLPAIVKLIPDGIGDAVSAYLTANGDAILAKALAIELGIEGLPANATEAQIQTFTTSVITALAGSSALAKSKLWSTIAYQFYDLVAQALAESTTSSLSYAQIVALIEKAYQDYLSDQSSQTATA